MLLAGAVRVGVAASLMDEIDRLVLNLNPVTIGNGRSLFDGQFALRPGGSSRPVPSIWASFSLRTYGCGDDWEVARSLGAISRRMARTLSAVFPGR